MSIDATGSGKLRKFEKGDVLIRENELSRKMFVLHKGKVRVYKSHMGQKVTLAVLNEGEIFGEMSFFDSKPRSATVEALTQVDVYVIDAEEANKQLATLPEWVKPVFRTVFDRLRTADTRTTLLQATNDFEKRHFKRDSLAQRVYKELLRFNGIFLLVYEEASRSGPVKRDDMLPKLDEVLGDRAISLQTYWKLLKEYDFVDRDREEIHAVVSARVPAIKAWIEELHRETQAETYTLLSHTAVAVLRRIIGRLDSGTLNKAPDERVMLSHEDLDLIGMPLLKEGLEELEKKGWVVLSGSQRLSVVPNQIFQVYTYQSLLKAFDHTVHHIG